MHLGVCVFFGAFLIAGCVGMLTGILGIGGGFLTTPAMIVFLGVPAPIAVGTDVAMIFATSSFGLYKRRKTNTVDNRLAIVMSAGSAIGVLIGMLTLELLKKMPPFIINGKEHIAVQYVLLILFAFLLTGIAAYMIYDSCCRSDMSAKAGIITGIRLLPCMRFSSLDTAVSVVLIVMLGAAIGFLTGLMGIGGGVLLLPCLIYLLGQNATYAAGTSLMIVWFSTMVGVVGHIKNGNVNVALLAAMVIGGIIGTYYGTKIGINLKHKKLCQLFSLIVAIAAILMVCKIYQITF